ncbi:MAG: polysaccharide deacetylase family protein [Steroidobacteraceae bacterium]|nr:polysaccharide deacetylase family protein [Steroidobacteraceae bacterium]
MSAFRRALRTFGRILRTRYPGFLLGLPVRAGEIPIFNYHDVEGPELRGDLEFLAANGYRTLTLEEFLARQGVSRNGHEVLLTFDDARASVASVALPLLQSFGAHAVLFVPTYWIGELDRRSPEAALFMSWNDVRRCQSSGVFSIECHAHRHALVHTSPHLVGFVSPSMRARYDVYDWPMRDAGGEQQLGYPQLGTPVYAAAPLLSTNRCYLESVHVARACQAHVEAEGGAKFFDSRHAHRALCSLHERGMARDGGRFMDRASLTRLVASEFEQSWDAFARHLRSRPRCFAFPWMVGSMAALRMAREIGAVAVFGCALDYRYERRRDLPVRVFGRLKSDWLRFLPGERRARLTSVLGRKVATFASLQNIAH